MTAAQILRRASSSLKIVLVERRGAVGEGVAYSTRDPLHLLNVPAGKMSAWPDRPDDFLAWARRLHGNVLATDFLPRQLYAAYIRDTLLDASAAAEGTGRLTIAFDEVRRIVRRSEGGWMLHFERGESQRADAVVLAIGHCPPSDPFGQTWNGPRTRFIRDPWSPFATSPVRPNEAIVIVGRGLTAVDVVLSLTQQPRGAGITLVSFNGSLPQRHALVPLPAADLRSLVSELVAEPGGLKILTLFRRLRKVVRELEAQGGDWRSVVDGLRPCTAELWRVMPSVERRKFLNRLRPFWEIHRHRTAPHVAERLRALLDNGQIRIIAGKFESAFAEGDEVRLAVRERGTRRRINLCAGWVVNCTGPTPSNRPESNSAIGSLLLRGEVRLDELGLGIETTLEGNAIAARSDKAADLFVVGALRKPELWESTAVPELREQAAEVAKQLLAHCNLNKQIPAPPNEAAKLA
jgi:uncharacterized NAD(P)/FAD-binding protein YdhS